MPLTVAFQLGVRRRPLGELWLRGAALVFDRVTLLLALGLMALPAAGLISALRGHAWIGAAWFACALAGALGAAATLRRLGTQGWRQLSLSLLVAGGIGSAIFLGAALAQHAALHQPTHFAPATFGYSFLEYLAVGFVLEEVSFRGALDAHLNAPGSWTLPKAFFASALWGLWHLPLVLNAPGAAPMPPAQRLLVLSISLVVVHSLIGVPLSYFYGKSGNLAVSDTSHAFIDAVRNAVGLLPS